MKRMATGRLSEPMVLAVLPEVRPTYSQAHMGVTTDLDLEELMMLLVVILCLLQSTTLIRSDRMHQERFQLALTRRCTQALVVYPVQCMACMENTQVTLHPRRLHSSTVRMDRSVTVLRMVLLQVRSTDFTQALLMLLHQVRSTDYTRRRPFMGFIIQLLARPSTGCMHNIQAHQDLLNLLALCTTYILGTSLVWAIRHQRASRCMQWDSCHIKTKGFLLHR